MSENGKHRSQGGSPGGGGPIYFLGVIGALVYYFQQAEGFSPHIVAILKALTWPGFVVYDLLKFLQA